MRKPRQSVNKLIVTEYSQDGSSFTYYSNQIKTETGLMKAIVSLSSQMSFENGVRLDQITTDFLLKPLIIGRK